MVNTVTSTDDTNEGKAEDDASGDMGNREEGEGDDDGEVENNEEGDGTGTGARKVPSFEVLLIQREPPSSSRRVGNASTTSKCKSKLP